MLSNTGHTGRPLGEKTVWDVEAEVDVVEVPVVDVEVDGGVIVGGVDTVMLVVLVVDPLRGGGVGVTVGLDVVVELVLDPPGGFEVLVDVEGEVVETVNCVGDTVIDVVGVIVADRATTV